MPFRFHIQLAYDGTPFYGWQEQSYTNQTLQGKIQKALSELFCHPIKVCGAGRTDRGVHALAQHAHFDVPAILGKRHLTPPLTKEQKEQAGTTLLHALNAKLSPYIVVHTAQLVPFSFHARHQSKSKTYIYRIVHMPCQTPLIRRYAYCAHKPFDFPQLQALSQKIVGYHDFKSFQTGHDTPYTKKEIFVAHWDSKKIHTFFGEENLSVFEITGSGFLKQMVRNLVGTLLEITLRGLPHSTFDDILQARDRKKALTTAPPQGLFLKSVHYDHDF